MESNRRPSKGTFSRTKADENFDRHARSERDRQSSAISSTRSSAALAVEEAARRLASPVDSNALADVLTCLSVEPVDAPPPGRDTGLLRGMRCVSRELDRLRLRAPSDALNCLLIRS